ncbi:MAG: DNA polymerase III, subunit gamma and tau [Candidatus Raymondbacteria bacterium RifOxyA12_full_50_37]|uniref:DNA polymerase III subunit gamma/tau n=1 Tax=Candidatus Raymondbacteria bacterium RIFOXYD12_FULL_49_13 TaxID=1817890 RepID=A0A1F7FC45_UNCRA|nr:MAG: DNA polymerase III, subunit gamma and tau [Candidatus Raymondbacteria bacterium RifOxyA12_full_50_37]OGJ89057.1 MAG: DNA polymerase III, subunit gamma and tau [Candidatus Raymondbacteria bacterium RIFOXYA2_FULL_49_16]OGJ97084.1 MAG: DNA polymerase III, subunit gamma and tau [Candidatus Raymondbacteria bacterium RIFOXYC2_FULL_50_21]OGK02569.1 MAG: DNA polymerase III, subunit gamma and tau [Candidatus Raymondbacteria bacterium RifOxyC12_full_50_8]OGK04057.1 MAG: DNA polymerase III, subuni
MAYLVLARKWRPSTFDDLVGQKHVARTLERAIATKRIAHAFLFTGTRGVGKTTSARILAMALNCETGPTAHPCGECSSCRSIKSGQGLDVMEIDGASNRGIDDIRELREQIGFTPAGGKFRIVIIDEVHMLTKEAFNALLKSLEEPPPNFIFIFATTEPQRVPETILSRVQRYDFKRISPADILGRLKQICDAEKVTYEEEALSLVAHKANGSMRDALTLLDQVIPFCANGITAAEVRSVCGLVNADMYRGLLARIGERDEAGLLADVAGIFSGGYDLAEFTNGLEEHLRNVLCASIEGVRSETLGISQQTFENCRNQANTFNRNDLLRMLELVSRLSTSIARSSMPRFELEAALLKLARMDSSIDIAAFIRGTNALPQVKKKSEPLSEPVSQPEHPAPPLPGPSVQASAARVIDPASIKHEWKGLVAALIPQNMQVGTYLTYSFVISSSEKELRIGLPDNQKFQLGQLTKPENMKVLKDFLRNSGGYDGALSFEAVSTEESKNYLSTSLPQFEKKDLTSAERPKKNINEAMAKEPVIHKVLDVFKGEVM